MKAQNKAGTWFQLYKLNNGMYLVYKLCENYHQGRMIKRWRMVLPNPKTAHYAVQALARNGMSKETATILFNKRINGTQK